MSPVSLHNQKNSSGNPTVVTQQWYMKFLDREHSVTPMSSVLKLAMHLYGGELSLTWQKFAKNLSSDDVIDIGLVLQLNITPFQR